MVDEMVYVPKEIFDRHVLNSALLNILYMRGLEKWDGYEGAYKYFQEVSKWPQWGSNGSKTCEDHNND